jgi:outer membrane cobalamin receptor
MNAYMRFGLLIAALAGAPAALAQIPSIPDSTRASTLDAVVVTAERSRSSLSSSIAAVTRLSPAELARVPRATLADVLRLAPGFTIIDLDGLGFDPQLMMRGFYGGGEAEYVMVLIDGRAVNQLQTGLVAWDVLPPLAAIEAVEVVRGSASPLYGDAAIGGVINVITRAGGGAPGIRWDASGGTFGTMRADIDASTARNFSFSGGLDRTDGFRDHAGRTSGRARASVAFADGPDAHLSVTARSHWREFEEPGALHEAQMAEDRRSSDPLFRFDQTTDQSHVVVLDGDRRVGDRTRISGSLGGELRNTDAIRTLVLAPGFGDTKQRDASNRRGATNIQLEIGDSPLPGADLLVIGAEGSYGALDSKYYPVAMGTQTDYESSTGQPGDLEEHGESARAVGAVYGQYTLQPVPALRLSVGGRFDGIRDSFDPRTPGNQSHRTSHSAFSPRAGINFRYLESDRGAGNVYAAVSRSFKAPTLDQLYDLRNIPIPPTFRVKTSNPDLEPQSGTSIEAGVYHGVALSPAVSASVSISAYHMDMKDELDFSVEEFRYVNIGRSRHRGLEAGLNLSGPTSSAFANYTLQVATARSGDNAGNRLKAIPGQTLSAGISVHPTRLLETSLLATHVRDIHLDDANAVELPDFTRLDARASLRVLGVDLFLDVRNLLNRKYSTTGYLDPAGSGEAYFYPAAGTVLELGVRGGW